MSNIPKNNCKSNSYQPSFYMLSQKGFSLIRLRGKVPVETGWERYCETMRNYDQIGFQPGENAGICCGSASNLLVIDVDDTKLFESICHENGWELPETYTVQTGNAGFHHYFRYSNDGKDYGNRSFKKLGFDIRGKGGQVVAPGSTHPETGKEYVRIKGNIDRISDPPGWLLRLYDKEAQSKQSNTKFDGSDGFDGLSIGVSDRIKKLILESKPKGERSEPIMSVIDALVAEGLSDKQIITIFDKYPIGEKYREKGSTMNKWLKTQIDKARDYVGEQKQQMNTILSFNKPLEFPLDFFPKIYRQAVKEISDAVVTPIEIPAVALISLVGACIGRKRSISMKGGWPEHPNLYMAIVGSSGIGKSPATNAIFKHVKAIEAQWYKEYKKQTGNSQKGGNGVTLKQLIVDDITSEALNCVLQDNPLGIFWNRDELAGLFLDLDKYAGKEGATMSRLMSAYDSGDWKVNRADNSKNTFIPNATLSIFGTIQPKALTEIFKERDIEVGFVPRFLFVIVEPDKPALWSEKEISQDTEANLSNLVKTLLGYSFDEKGKPIEIHIEEDARKSFIEWHDKILLESWLDADNEYRNTIAKKLHAQCLRFALITHCMESVAEGKSDCKPITKGTVDKAIRLAEYFKEQKYEVMNLIINNKYKNISPILKLVGRAILQLECEITKGMLATSRVTEIVNLGSEEKYQIEVSAVGKAATSLELTTKRMPDGKHRGIVIQKKDIKRLKILLGIPSEPSEVSDI